MLLIFEINKNKHAPT